MPRPLLLVAALASFLAACTPATETPAPGLATTPRPTSPPNDEEQQRQRGAKYYAYDCAACHGEDGRGTDGGPPVIGPHALPVDPPSNAKHRTGRFVDAHDLFAFMEEHMPSDKIGGMPSGYYFDVLAFLLARNGVATPRIVDEKSLSQLPIHPKGQ